MDVSQVDQLLANLSINARDAIAGVGTLTVTTANRLVDAPMWDAHMHAAPGDYVQLTVRDDGCGMASDVRARVFEPFFTTKDVGEGTGLGLATVYGIVQQGNGFIEMASAPGEGTTFEIYFPRYLGDLAASDSADPAAPIPRGTETILVVEDEPAVRRVTARALEAQGYDVLEADGPHAAIRVAQERGEAITLLLTDVVMPEMSGHELADALAADHPHLKHLFMSGYPERGGKRREPPEDAAPFLVKPFTLAELATKVRAVMDCE
jgi:CheY-like chemotaxis protein